MESLPKVLLKDFVEVPQAIIPRLKIYVARSPSNWEYSFQVNTADQMRRYVPLVPPEVLVEKVRRDLVEGGGRRGQKEKKEFKVILAYLEFTASEE